ncbi:MAG: TRAP transporter small permease subunit [Pseudomonadota bacterium]
MLTTIGEVLMLTLWCVVAPTLIVPIGAMVSDRSRIASAVLPFPLSLTVVFAFLLFSHLAVDLRRPDVNPYAFFLLLITLCLICATGAKWGADRIAQSIDGLLRPIVTAIGKATGLFVLAMALIQFTVVVLRYVFGWNSILLQESVTYLHGGTFLLAAGYALLTNDHVRVDIFYGSASPRRRAIIDLFGCYVFLFPFCLLTIAMSAPYVANSWAALEGSTEQSGIQAVFLLKSLIPAFAVLLLAAGFIIATDAARTIRDTKPAPKEATA